MTQTLTPTQTGVSLCTLGQLALPDTPFARPKPLLLLAYLALEGPKDKRFLAELFFPENEDPNSSLRQTLTRLRRAGTGLIGGDAQRLWTPLYSDAAAFLGALEARDLERAAALYRGAFLTGVQLPELGFELEEWVYATREFLAGALRGALLNLAEEAAGLGETLSATRYAERAYRVADASDLEPEAFELLFALLMVGRSPLAPNLRAEAEAVGLELTFSPEPPDEVWREPHPVHAPTPLPTRVGTFIGREVEQTELADVLSRPDVRLLTLVGPGGVGKTRLALEVAAVQQDRFAGGVVFAALETLTTPSQFPEAVAGALGLTLQADNDALSRVVRALGDRQVLLVLDTFEHLLDAIPTLNRLLAGCSGLTLLVTSRERLSVGEEWVFALDGLGVPPAGAPLEDALRYDAVRFFVGRARRARLSFTPTPRELPSVLKICERVQGSPLGIELAAGWVKLLPCAEIAKGLERNLGFPSTSRHDVPTRQRSLRAVFESSWGCLNEAERQVLGKLSVFRGGFTRQAAAEVAGATLPLLASLVDKSLLRVGEGRRFDRHMLVAGYTREKLAENAQEEAQTKGEHAAYFLRLAEAAELGLKTDRQKAWLEQLEEEFDNLRAAFDYFVVQEVMVDQALGLASALHHFWWFRHAREGQAWLGRALGHSRQRQKSEARAKACYTAGEAFYLQGDLRRATACLEESLALYRRVGDRPGAAKALGSLANLILAEGDIAAAEARLRESLATLREHGDDWSVAETLHHLGHIASSRGDFASARALHEEGLALFRTLGDGFSASVLLMYLSQVALEQEDFRAAKAYIAQSLALQHRLGDEKVNINLAFTYGVLGLVATAERDYALAKSYHCRSLELRRELGHKPGVIISLARLAGLALRTGDAESAAHLWGSAEAARRTSPMALSGRTRARYVQELAQAKAQLGEERFAAAQAKGQEMRLEEAVEYALKTDVQGPV